MDGMYWYEMGLRAGRSQTIFGLGLAAAGLAIGWLANEKSHISEEPSDVSAGQKPKQKRRPKFSISF